MCVFVALGVVHHAMRVRHTVVCDVPGSTVRSPPRYLINGTIFGGEKKEKKTLLHIKFVGLFFL